MTRRHLSPDEQALWSALTRSIKPIRASTPVQSAPLASMPPVAVENMTGLTAKHPRPLPPPPARAPAPVLDSSWERRIRGGALVPDMAIDLHGHSLAGAHGRLNQAIAAALARDARIMLVVTGKPPLQGAGRDPSRRGAIRAEIGHWLETSPYADRIASVRIAHPRHGGDGAIYLILRRKK